MHSWVTYLIIFLFIICAKGVNAQQLSSTCRNAAEVFVNGARVSFQGNPIGWDRYLPPAPYKNVDLPGSVRMISNYQNITASMYFNKEFNLTDFFFNTTIVMQNGGEGVAIIIASTGFDSATALQLTNDLQIADGIQWPTFTGLAVFASPSRREIVATVTSQGAPSNTLSSLRTGLTYRVTNVPLTGDKVVYGVRVSNDTVSIEACLLNSRDCADTTAIKNLQMPSLRSLFTTTKARWGLGAYNLNLSASIDVYDVGVYKCSGFEGSMAPVTTKPTVAPTLASTQGLATTIGPPTTAPIGPGKTAPIGPSGKTDSTAAERQISLVHQSASQKLHSNVFPNFTEPPIQMKSVNEVKKECTDFSPDRASPPGSVTLVRPAFAVERFVEINTVDETITVVGGMLLSWAIRTCPADSTDAFSKKPPAKMYVAESKDVWAPSYRYEGSSGDIYMTDYGEDLTAIVTHPLGQNTKTIDFYWTKEGTFKSACKFDLATFPFDKQTCVFSFSLVRPDDLVRFNEPLFYWPDDTSYDSEWHYEGRATYLGQMYSKGLPASVVHFSVTMKRNPSYYITNIIIPDMALIAVEFGSFILPPYMSDRPMFSITVLLSISVSQSVVLALVPRTSQRVILVDYMGGLLWISAGCTIYQMVMCWFADARVSGQVRNGEVSSPKSKRVAKILRVFDAIALVLAVGSFAALTAYLFAASG